MLPIVKHMPGHGRAVADSHFDTPHVDASLQVLDACDFAPFRALNNLPMGMTAHIRLSAVADRPATAAPEVIALIRDRIAFGGLLMTDDIGMNALSGTESERAAAAIAAGCDLVLHCNGDIAAMEQVAAAAGTMSAAAARRADAALALRRPPAPDDLAALAAEYDALPDPAA